MSGFVGKCFDAKRDKCKILYSILFGDSPSLLFVHERKSASEMELKVERGQHQIDAKQIVNSFSQ